MQYNGWVFGGDGGGGWSGLVWVGVCYEKEQYALTAGKWFRNQCSINSDNRIV